LSTSGSGKQGVPVLTIARPGWHKGSGALASQAYDGAEPRSM
jgi:hypothetical protein